MGFRRGDPGRHVLKKHITALALGIPRIILFNVFASDKLLNQKFNVIRMQELPAPTSKREHENRYFCFLATTNFFCFGHWSLWGPLKAGAPKHCLSPLMHITATDVDAFL